MDVRSCADCRGFVTSVTLGFDLVGRLSIKSLGLMREKVLDLMLRCKVNKMVVMQMGFKVATSSSAAPLCFSANSWLSLYIGCELGVLRRFTVSCGRGARLGLP